MYSQNYLPRASFIVFPRRQKHRDITARMKTPYGKTTNNPSFIEAAAEVFVIHTGNKQYIQ